MQLTRYLEYEIYVPAHNPERNARAPQAVEKIKAGLIDFFGGITDSQIKFEGLWKTGGLLMRDQIVIWKIMSDLGGAGDAAITEAKSELERELEQEEVLVVRRQVERFK